MHFAGCEKGRLHLVGRRPGTGVLTHVKCPECGTTFNGKTVCSNRTGIIVYSVVLGIIGIGLLILISQM